MPTDCTIELSIVPKELNQILHTFLGLLTSEAVIHTRILCRMSVILIQEISVFLIERGLWLPEGDIEDNIRGLEVAFWRFCFLSITWKKAASLAS